MDSRLEFLAGQFKAGTHPRTPEVGGAVSTSTSPLILYHAVSHDDARFILGGFLVISGEICFTHNNNRSVISIRFIEPTRYHSTSMDRGSLNCSRCHVIVGFDCDLCSACQSALPAIGSPWPTILAHGIGVGSHPNVDALDNAPTATPNSTANIPVTPRLTLVRSGFMH